MMHNNGEPGPQSVSSDTIDGIVGTSAPLTHVCRLAHKAAASRYPVLLTGETGTGKNLFASAVHRLSPRASAPFVVINCAAYADEELEKVLFGSALEQPSAGRIESASTGTLFLDEIDALPLRLQVRLLQVLKESGFERERDFVPTDIRLIAATDKDPGEKISDGMFREDLFWQLNVVPIAMPPLRRRPADVEPLVRHFLEQASAHSRTIDRLHPDAIAALTAYQWPGNISELKTYIERAVALAEGDELTSGLLPPTVKGDAVAAQDAVFRPTDEASLIREFVYSRMSKASDDATDLHKQIVQPVEKELLLQVLDSVNQTQTKAATRLGINRNTLYKKLKEHGLEKSPSKRSTDSSDAADGQEKAVR